MGNLPILDPPTKQSSNSDCSICIDDALYRAPDEKHTVKVQAEPVE